MAGYNTADVTGHKHESVRIWEMHGDYGFENGWGSEEDLVWAVEEWFGVVTSYAGVEETSSATLSVGITPQDEEVLDVAKSMFIFV